MTARSTFTPKSQGLSAPSLGPPPVTPPDRRCPCPAWPKAAAGHTTSGGFGSASRPWVFLPARGRSRVLYVQVGSICCPCPLNLKMGPGSFCRDRNRSQEGTGAHRAALLTTLTPCPHWNTAWRSSVVSHSTKNADSPGPTQFSPRLVWAGLRVLLWPRDQLNSFLLGLLALGWVSQHRCLQREHRPLTT